MQRRILSLIATCLAVAFAPTLRPQTPNAELPLPEEYFPKLKSLLETATKQSPRMIARNTEEVVALATRDTYRAGQLPSAGGVFSYNPWDRQTREYAGPGTTSQVQRIGYSFSIGQPLFHWGALRNTTRIGEIQLKLAQGQTAEVYRLLAYEIRASFLQLIMRKAGVARARFASQIADRQLALARSKREKNVISDADLFSPTIAAEEARLAADRAAETYERTKTYFARMCGVASVSDEEIPDAIPPVQPVQQSIESLVREFTAKAEPDTFALRSIRYQIDIERLNYSIARTRLLPKLSLAVGVTQDQQKLTVSEGVPYKVRDITAGGTVAWSVFDGFAARAAKHTALARRRQLERTLETEKRDALETVEHAATDMAFTARNLAIVEKQLESARNVLVANREDLKRGIVSEAGVNAAQLSFYDAEIGTFGVRYEYIMQVCDVLSKVMHDPALANLPAKYR
jgi:outer membrane protein TolC